jgi:hypothetical protein
MDASILIKKDKLAAVGRLETDVSPSMIGVSLEQGNCSAAASLASLRHVQRDRFSLSSDQLFL